MSNVRGCFWVLCFVHDVFYYWEACGLFCCLESQELLSFSLRILLWVSFCFVLEVLLCVLLLSVPDLTKKFEKRWAAFILCFAYI